MCAGAVARSSVNKVEAVTATGRKMLETGILPTSDDPAAARCGNSWSGQAMPALESATRAGCMWLA